MGISQIMGEFGCYPDDDIGREMLAYNLDIFEKNGLSWAYW